ncbi:MAG TPA: integrin alpha, partial [Chitinophagaceae bacterium]|nr:integrin alpha [Chitinophagaceae bacterium]
MHQKLLLSAILLFLGFSLTNVEPAQKLKSPVPAFVFTKTMHLNKKTKAGFTPFWETSKKNNNVDTAALKRSNWYGDVIRNIEASEYEIKRDDKTGLYCGPNRQQQLRAFFNYNSFTLQPRSEEKGWTLRMQLTGIYANKKLIACPGENDLPVIGSNKIIFNNDDFSTEYINSKEGIRQNFIIQKDPASKPACPAGRPQTLNIKLQTDKGWYINKVHDKELHFAKHEGDQLSKKITYNSLKVWDANNKELAARFVVNKKHAGFDIEVNTSNAVYPITIDPLSTTPNSILDDCDQANANFGISVASAGDVNGDGYSDVIIGAYSFDDGFTDEGKAFVYHGSATGLSATPNSTPDDADQAGANFGYCVASAGDVNGDGYSDIIIGAFSFDEGFTDEGKAFVYHGSAAGLSATPNSTPDDADQAFAQVGISVASAGDVNGDGFSDVMIGARLYDDGFSDEGKVFVYHGSATGLSATPNSTPDDADQLNAYFGFSIASAGDINGDGYSDVIIGAYSFDDGFTDEGKAFVYHGSAAGLSATPNSTPDDADQVFAYFGFSVASAGDVNADGYSDVIIGAYQYNDGANIDEGLAFVYHGSAAGLSASPNNTPDDADQSGANFGVSVACAGDVNGDGYSDVIIGAWTYDDSGNNDEGRAFVYFGSATGLSATPNSTPDDADQAFAQFGISVASAGDVNGDGYSDVIIGANGFNDGANTDEGRTFVYNGSPGKLNTTEQVQLDNSQNNAQMGYSVACAGDVNGDGYSDVIIGARYFTNGQQEEGAVFIYYGSTTGVSNVVQTQLEVNVAYANLGTSVSCAGDVNGDGYSDVVVSSAQAINGGCAAFVYHGSSTGITTTVQTQITNGFGSWIVSISVASAGDVNGDGYSDIIIGSFYYENGQNQEGGA